MSFDLFDRWRERQKWIPNWIDSADWKTWILHTLIVLVWGLMLAWVSPIPLVWCWRLLCGLYLWREIRNVRDRLRLQWPLKPLDHVMDVAAPVIASELLAWWLL